MQNGQRFAHMLIHRLWITGIVLVAIFSVQMSGAAADVSQTYKQFLPAIASSALCPAWVHARYTTAGPDGKQYPTWHPPIDPEFGCLFGHEHGADPRTANADATLPAFGYAAALMGMSEPHEGFKVFVI